MLITTDFETWVLDYCQDRIFRMHNTQKESLAHNACTYVKIVEIIELPNRNILIGYKEILNWEEYEDEKVFENLPTHYRPLEQMQLSFFPDDMKEGNWE